MPGSGGGDAVMAFFGAPGELNKHPQKAAQTALEMIERLTVLKAEQDLWDLDHHQ